MRVGLSVYGTTFSMGVHPAAGRPTLRPQQLMDQAIALDLQGVELPFVFLDGADIEALKQYAQERQLFITLDTYGFDPEHLGQVLELGARLGAGTVRTLVGGARLGGDRREMVGHWQDYLQQALAGLRKATVVAERLGINLAVENHQDIASEELLWLCTTIDSPQFGITFDTGNPLATAEEPIDFTRRIAPYVKHVHLKDYWIYLSEEGYRLVRCPLGQGVIDFPAMLEILDQTGREITKVVELGALEGRHVRALADDYWLEYPPRSASQFAHVWRFVQDHARPAGEWRTPFERGESVDAVVAYEQRQLISSLAYLQGVFRIAEKQLDGHA
ncbi:sugar phosphate isomerase/epimerase family protein [Dictyobacter kobayashii]|uniref:Xylose isomerase n=1 Tax=Dictyobacter kobayashii TaxID=2014872 RepID=A0A402ATQ7_9CHLR|nr:sugar phosphate isomerase/epimerase family protein [Dictyobacter kobayashii]GCE22546.1 xylose isomerase [Dictyobacter kobayashii]